jgi:hypothetical protein
MLRNLFRNFCVRLFHGIKLRFASFELATLKLARYLHIQKQGHI